MRVFIDRSVLVAAFVAVLGALFSICSPAAAAERAVHSPEVTHTGKGPTGYTVTFRYANPTAKKVQIKGEWFFARPSELPQIAATPDHPVVESQGLRPEDWRPGDFPLQRPNSTGPNFPIADMTKGKDGVWTYTTPLPSGTFTYAFFVDCPAPTPGPQQPGQSQCRISDPGNRPWNEKNGAVVGSVTSNSQVYVPSDPAFNTLDYSWQGPAKLKGTLTHETYASPGHVTPANENYLVVYTPPNYDAARARPYPTLYLSHGGGENEMGWSTQGVLGNIMDNLINSGQIQPVVVVMPNASGYATSTLNEAYDRDLIDHMIPYVAQHFHVSKSATDRAFSGLSLGGMLTNTFIIKHAEVFQYYGMMSAGLPAEFGTLSAEQIAALKGKSIWIGGGWQDVIHAAGFNTTHTGPAREVSTFAKAGIPVTTIFVNGGHEWYVWRILLKDFLTRVAFLPQPYAAW
jgi:enterochelin esterase-like enzyme